MKRTPLLMATVLIMMLLGAGTGQAQLYGEFLDHSDRLAVAHTFQYALENNSSGTAATWNNPDTDLAGSTIPLKTFQTIEGTFCREYQQQIFIAGKREQGFGTACRQADGSWRIVASDSGSVRHNDSGQIQGDRYDNPWAFADAYRSSSSPYTIPLSFRFFYHNGHAYDRHKYDRGGKHHYRGGKSVYGKK